MKTKEVFKQVPGYEHYLISNYGNLISTKFGKKRYMNVKPQPTGYVVYALCQNGIYERFYAHRLVMQVFGPKRKKGENCTNHIDGDKTNNYIGNLESCSQKHNVNQAVLMKLKPKMYANKARKVLVINPETKQEIEIHSMYTAAKLLNVTIAAIYNCCTGRQGKVKGMIVKYAD